MTFFESLLAQSVTTTTVEEIRLARWSSGNALLIGGLLTALALYAVFWMYRREARGQVSGALKWGLVGCRAGVLLLIGLIALEPVIISYIERRQAAYTLVLIDDSASMSLADQYRNAEDAQRVEQALGPISADGLKRSTACEQILHSENDSWLRSLAEHNEVKLFTFSRRLEPLGMVRAHANSDEAREPNPNDIDEHRTVSWSITPDGSATDLGRAVRAAVDSVAGSPVAGLVLLSDGCFNTGEPPAVIAKYLDEKRIAVFAAGIGDPAMPVNVRLAQIDAPRAVFKEDPFSITVHVEADGVDRDELQIELLERRDAAPPQVVQTRTFSLARDTKSTSVVFERKISEAGSVGYSARVLPLDYEAVKSDNEREINPPITVLDDKLKVLLIAGAPSYDYRFLARMLERDESVELSTWLQSADINAIRDGNVVITELPNTIEDVNRYDVVMLMDPDPREFDPTWDSLIASYVADHGGGMLVAAGNKHTGSFFRAPNTKALIELLPVVPDPEAEVVINELGHYQTKAWPILIPSGATNNSILAQANDPTATSAVWASLGNLYWHFPVRREKPIAQALMRHSNPRMSNSFGQHVLLAAQYVGAGRTAYLGINSTWRWRKFDERPFNRFWMQLLRYLAEGKLLGGKSRGEIMTQQDEFEPGETVALTVRVLDERFQPLLLPELELSVTRAVPVVAENAPDEEAERIVLVPIPGKDGYYEGRYLPKRPGAIRLEALLPGESVAGPEQEKRSVQKVIVIAQPDIEMRSTAMNRAGLKELIETAGHGSRYFEINELDELPPLIQDQSRTSRHVGRITPLWSNVYSFCMLVGLLMIEWILRKKAKLL